MNGHVRWLWARMVDNSGWKPTIISSYSFESPIWRRHHFWMVPSDSQGTRWLDQGSTSIKHGLKKFFCLLYWATGLWSVYLLVTSVNLVELGCELGILTRVRGVLSGNVCLKDVEFDHMKLTPHQKVLFPLKHQSISLSHHVQSKPARILGTSNRSSQFQPWGPGIPSDETHQAALARARSEVAAEQVRLRGEGRSKVMLRRWWLEGDAQW